MSISKVQAEALAEGFLEGLGSDDKKSLRPKQTFTDIILLAAEFVGDAQDNLNKTNSNASGKLSASLQLSEPEATGLEFRVNVYMNYYGRFVNKGVKGTRSGSSLAGYSFKNEFPSENMVKSIWEWISRTKLSTRTIKKYDGYGAHESKNKSIAAYDNAYAVARSIKMHGIKPTGFLDQAAATTAQKVKERLGLALKVDIINSIT